MENLKKYILINMYRLSFFIILMILLPSFCFSQDYSEDNKKFVYKNRSTFEISSNGMDNNLKPTLKITEIRNGKQFVQQLTIFNVFPNGENKYYENAEDLYFSDFIDKERKYIIIASRNKFCILNLYNNRIIGTFLPKFYGIGQDAQSGMLSGLKIIMDGRFIIGYCVDSGTFLCDLTDLYHYQDGVSVNNPYYHQNHLYILPDLENKGKSFGLFVSAENWEVDAKIIFTNKIVEYDDYSLFEQLSEVEIEEKMANYSLVDSKYTILKEILPENDYKFIVIDNNTGDFIYLPTEKEKSNKLEVIKYLEKL